MALSLFSLLSTAKADQPVSCLNKAPGTWNFHVSQDTDNIDLYKTASVCTHQQPNKLQLIDEDYRFQFANEQVYQVELRDDQTATAKICGKFDNMKCSDSTEVQGSWIAFYDQAFKVELNNGQRFLTNYRYSVKTGTPAKQGSAHYLEMEIDDYDRFYSDCD